jgi:hypothetical protein
MYKTEDSYGHWTCLLKNRYGYEFFDPYGIILDDQLKYVNPEMTEDEKEQFKSYNKQNYRYLTNLLSKVHEPVSYNHHKFQKFKRNGERPATCGRHVVLRLLNKDMSLAQYKREFDKAVKGLNLPDQSYDEAATLLVDDPKWD